MFNRWGELFFSFIPFVLSCALAQERGFFLLVGLCFFVFSSLWGIKGALLSIPAYLLFFAVPSAIEVVFLFCAMTSGFLSFAIRDFLAGKEQQSLDEELCHTTLISHVQEQHKYIQELEKEIRVLEDLVTTVGSATKPPTRKKQVEKGQIFFPLEALSNASKESGSRSQYP